MSDGKKEILLGDCLELMKDIPNRSIDMILCDLPYEVTSLGWDSAIDTNELFNQYNRIISDKGAIVLFGTQPFSAKLIMANIEYFRYEWVWQKDSPSNIFFAQVQPLKYHENILVFSKAKAHNQAKVKMTYNPQMQIRKEENKRNNNIRKNNKSYLWGEGREFDCQKQVGNEDLIYPSSIQYCNRVRNGVHTSEKPLTLFEYLIKTYTNEGDLVLDNTAGSGTTAIACLNTKRQFIVMEKEQKYYDIILKSVADFNKIFLPKTLFGNEM